MSGGRRPPYAVGTEKHTGTIVAVLKVGPNKARDRYLVRRACCGVEQDMSGAMLASYESYTISNGDVQVCRKCAMVGRVVRIGPAVGSHAWAHEVMTRAARGAVCR